MQIAREGSLFAEIWDMAVSLERSSLREDI